MHHSVSGGRCATPRASAAVIRSSPSQEADPQRARNGNNGARCEPIPPCSVNPPPPTKMRRLCSPRGSPRRLCAPTVRDGDQGPFVRVRRWRARALSLGLVAPVLLAPSDRRRRRRRACRLLGAWGSGNLISLSACRLYFALGSRMSDARMQLPEPLRSSVGLLVTAGRADSLARPLRVH